MDDTRQKKSKQSKRHFAKWQRRKESLSAITEGILIAFGVAFSIWAISIFLEGAIMTATLEMIDTSKDQEATPTPWCVIKALSRAIILDANGHRVATMEG